jgi:hypothetical protein
MAESQAVLNTLSEHDYQDTFKEWQKHWELCMCVEVDYFEDVRFEVFTAVTMKYAVLWNVTLYGSCKNRHFRGTQHVHHQGDKNR